MKAEHKPTPQPFPIEKGIPVPPDIRGLRKYPWNLMDTGDSFFVPNRKVVMPPKHPTKKWTQRTVEENGVRGIRIWRIA
jgi:hypothetical protein